MKNPNRFWNWFQDNHHTFKSILHQDSSIQKESLYWIKKNLGYYNTELNYFLVIPQNDKEKFEVVFTAVGDTNHFIHLFNLLDNAPPLRSWKFTAMMATQEQITHTISKIAKPFILRDITIQNNDQVFTSLHKADCLADNIIILNLKTQTIICNFDQLDQIIYSIINNSQAEAATTTEFKLVQLPASRGSHPHKIYLSELLHYIETMGKLVKI